MLNSDKKDNIKSTYNILYVQNSFVLLVPSAFDIISLVRWANYHLIIYDNILPLPSYFWNPKYKIDKYYLFIPLKII